MTNQVIVVTGVPVKLQVDAVVHETEVETHIKLVLLLEGEFAVGQTAQLKRHFLSSCLRTPGLARIEESLSIGIARGACLCCQRVRQTQLSIAQSAVALPVTEPGLLVDVPTSRNVPCGQPAVLV